MRREVGALRYCEVVVVAVPHLRREQLILSPSSRTHLPRRAILLVPFLSRSLFTLVSHIRLESRVHTFLPAVGRPLASLQMLERRMCSFLRCGSIVPLGNPPAENRSL